MYLAIVAGLEGATDEGPVPKIAQYGPYYLPLNVFTASKGSYFYIFIHIIMFSVCFKCMKMCTEFCHFMLRFSLHG